MIQKGVTIFKQLKSLISVQWRSRFSYSINGISIFGEWIGRGTWTEYNSGV